MFSGISLDFVGQLAIEMTTLFYAELKINATNNFVNRHV